MTKQNQKKQKKTAIDFASSYFSRTTSTTNYWSVKLPQTTGQWN